MSEQYAVRYIKVVAKQPVNVYTHHQGKATAAGVIHAGTMLMLDFHLVGTYYIKDYQYTCKRFDSKKEALTATVKDIAFANQGSICKYRIHARIDTCSTNHLKFYNKMLGLKVPALAKRGVMFYLDKPTSIGDFLVGNFEFAGVHSVIKAGE